MRVPGTFVEPLLVYNLTIAEMGRGHYPGMTAEITMYLGNAVLL